jgi:hypothetical protein
VVEVDERAAGPEPGPELFPSDNLARPLQQDGEDLEWLILQFDLEAALAQLPSRKISLKDSKSYDTAVCGFHPGHLPDDAPRTCNEFTTQWHFSSLIREMRCLGKRRSVNAIGDEKHLRTEPFPMRARESKFPGRLRMLAPCRSPFDLRWPVWSRPRCARARKWRSY